MTRPDLISIRDPIHGAIGVTPRELGIVETRAFQRLRTIKQLGFADHAFPGATHTRFAHALGAMEMAARMFDAIFEGTALPAPDRARLRQALRLAVLLHDIGHAPLSHATERCMPPLRHLGLAELTGAKLADRQARHEDYTVKLLLDSHLSEALRRTFADDGIDPEDVARLVDEAPDEPTTRITTDTETFCCLGGGRWQPDRALAEGSVTIGGDVELGEAVVRSLNFMI